MSVVVPAMPMEQFFAILERRGLTLSLNDEGKLALSGPQEKRTDRLRDYIRANKTEITLHLHTALELRALAAEADAELLAHWHALVEEAHQAALQGRFPESIAFAGYVPDVGKVVSPGADQGKYVIDLPGKQFTSRYALLQWARRIHGPAWPAKRAAPSYRTAEAIVTALTLWWHEHSEPLGLPASDSSLLSQAYGFDEV